VFPTVVALRERERGVEYADEKEGDREKERGRERDAASFS